ncbi:MAG: NADH-quinone oxidoreductase subunit A [Verrucomicrobiota bacterium]
MSIEAYLPILIQVLLAVAIGASIIIANRIFGQRAAGNPTKDSAYECGLPMAGPSHTRFSVKFYVTAMLFILFDIETVFLIPWVLVYRDFLAVGIPILLPALFFIGVLVIGLIYELKKGALEWEK